MRETVARMAGLAYDYRKSIAVVVVATMPLVGSAGAVAVGVWLTVNEHTGKLTAIQEQQTAQVAALAAAKAEVVAEQRRNLDRVEQWQAASLQRDLDITGQLGSIARALGKLEGKMDRAAAYQGWRVTPRADSGGAPAEGMRN